MLKLVEKLFREEEGQGLVEYALIIGLVSVALVVALGFLKDDIAQVFSDLGKKIGGTGGVTP
jgi:pilus assembly protein Flp/PilA